ncbi:MAG: hypothetical protein JNN30_14870 [Rhodanobacteraceae bacterium]|nr:hypothetical protein [Rhodanobacteraceae bacterium]
MRRTTDDATYCDVLDDVLEDDVLDTHFWRTYWTRTFGGTRDTTYWTRTLMLMDTYWTRTFGGTRTLGDVLDTHFALPPAAVVRDRTTARLLRASFSG